MQNQGSEMLTYIDKYGTQFFRCTICGFYCEHQRTIKAHIWKHSGHKHVDYPMFQNGPISLHDKHTPDDEVVLLNKSQKHVITTMSGEEILMVNNEQALQDNHTKSTILKSAHVIDQKSMSKTKVEDTCKSISDMHNYAAPASEMNDNMKHMSSFSLNDDSSKDQLEQSVTNLVEQIWSKDNRKSVVVQPVPQLDPQAFDTTSETEMQSVSSDDPTLLSEPYKIGPNLAHTTTSISSKQSSSKTNISSGKETGISSSLLAVIEQFREHTSDGEASFDSEHATSGTVCQGSDCDQTCLGEESFTLRKSKADDDIFRCTICHYTNSRLELMKNHMKQHKVKPPGHCPLCHYVATTSKELEEHVIQHCSTQIHQCNVCGYSFNYKSQLQAHVRAHEEFDSLSKYSCNQCTYQTFCAMEHQNHMRTHNAHFSWIIPICQCKMCYTKSTKSHVDSANFYAETKGCKTTNQRSYCGDAGNTEKRMLMCHLCDFAATSNRSLKSHMKRHVIKKPLQQYKCKLCGYMSGHLPSLKSHMWKHAGDRSYNYSANNDILNAILHADSTNDNSNVTSRNSLVTLRCECGFETEEKSVLDTHMSLH